ncbi:MAG: dicarboxylate/amino acid:cation symporter [Clostridium sp.]|nr:dicarboxylate/amino acid:cation symporter [Clostridium sp.]
MRKLSLIGRIAICLILGIIIGLSCKSIFLDFPIRILVTISGLFGNFLSFIIPLIIIAFIVPGIASLGKKSGKGLLITTILAYISTITAGTLTYIVSLIALPNFLKGNINLSESAQGVSAYFAIEMPAIMNVMSALILAFILGIGLSRIEDSKLLVVFNEFSDIVLKVIKGVLIPFVPIYIGCIFANLAYNGEIVETLKSFAVVYIVLFSMQAIYILIQYVIAGTIKKENPFKLLKNMIPAYLTAVGTQSSAATIPVTLKSVENNKVSSEVKDFVVPLCATIHLAGDTITLVVTSMAVMYMNGQEPTFSKIMPFILMLGVTMIAAPGIPGGGVMAALGLLETMFGFGTVEKPIMIALHAAQDSFGTATNITGDGAIAIIVDYILNRKDKNKAE